MQFFKDIQNFKYTKKFWIALATVVVVFLEANFGGDSEVVQLVIALLGAFGVYKVENNK